MGCGQLEYNVCIWSYSQLLSTEWGRKYIQTMCIRTIGEPRTSKRDRWSKENKKRIEAATTISFSSLSVARSLRVPSPWPLLSDSSSSRVERSVVLAVQKLPHGGWPVRDD